MYQAGLKKNQSNLQCRRETKVFITQLSVASLGHTHIKKQDDVYKWKYYIMTANKISELESVTNNSFLIWYKGKWRIKV